MLISGFPGVFMLVLGDQSPILLGDSGDFPFFSQGFQGDNVTQVDWRTLHRSPGVGWLGSQAKIGKLCEPRW